MDQRGPRDETGPPVAAPAEAIRDAEAVARRVAEDEAAAVEARVRYRTTALSALEPSDRVRPMLGAAEHVVAERRSVFFDRRRPEPGPIAFQSLPGSLYITSARVILIGRVTIALALSDIADVVTSAERLLLTMRDGTGVALDVDHPRLLRVEIAAARAAARS